MNRTEIAMPLIKAAADAYQVTPAAVLSRNRQHGPSYARFAVAHVLRLDHDWSAPMIADALRRDASTVSDLCKRARELLSWGGPTFERCVARVRSAVLAEPSERQTPLRRLPSWVPVPLARGAA